MSNTIPITRPEPAPTYDQINAFLESKGWRTKRHTNTWIWESEEWENYISDEWLIAEQASFCMTYGLMTGKPEHIIYDEVMKC